MPRPTISVSAPSRLHFGLFPVGEQVERQFGGMGLMIRNPRTRVVISESKQFSVVGDQRQRIHQIVQLWLSRFGSLVTPPISDLNELDCQLELVEKPPQHGGFGSGTQLAMSCATALFRIFELPLPKPGELAIAMGRGGRASIGSHGFVYGGLLVDRGNTDEDPVSPLDFQTNFPEDWPILVAMLQNHQGLSGVDEICAFEQLPAVSPQAQQSLIERVNKVMVPAVVSKDYATFAKELYEFGNQCGLFFQSVQGGPYNGPEVEGLVETIRKSGIRATGQSSWGPCVYAVCPDMQSAERLNEHLETTFGPSCRTMITRADNSGVQTDVVLPKNQAT